MAKPLNVLVLGCDGYIGWPVTCRLLREGHSVMGIDAGFKRSHYEFDVPGASVEDTSLVPIDSIEVRKRYLPKFWVKDIRERQGIDQALYAFSPDVIIHLAEIGSRAFAMRDSAAADKTVCNNLATMTMVISAVKSLKPATHIIKLSTVEAKAPMRDFCTIAIQTVSLMLEMACKVLGLRATEITIGLVYGSDQREFCGKTRFDYDVYFGNVVHRFLAQGLSGNPITIYGDGSQNIGLTHLRDVVDSVAQAVRTAAHEPGKPLVQSGTLRRITCCGQAVSVNHIGKTINKALELKMLKPPSISYLPNPRGTEMRAFVERNTSLSRFGVVEVAKLISEVQPYVRDIKPHLVRMRDPTWAEVRR